MVIVVAIAALYVVIERSNHIVPIEPPSRQIVNPNAYSELVALGAELASLPSKPLASMLYPPETQQDFEKKAGVFAKDATPLLSKVPALLKQPYLHPAVTDTELIVSPEDANLREVARALITVADYREHAGDFTGAVAARLDTLELGVMLPRGGRLLELQLGWIIQSMAASRLEGLFERLSPAQLEDAAGRLDRIIGKHVPFADVVREEAYFSVNLVQSQFLRSQSLPSILQLHHELYSAVADPGTKQPGIMDSARFVFANKQEMIDHVSDYFDALVHEYEKPITKTWPVTVNPEPLLQALDLDFIRQSFAKHTSYKAMLEMLRVETCLLRYRAANGRFPNALGDLIPVYQKGYPVDPFGGQKFVYRAVDSGKTYLLYSLGPNMEDDSGEPILIGSNSPGDLVAGKLFPKRNLW
jgi:hypothetical protein